MKDVHKDHTAIKLTGKLLSWFIVYVLCGVCFLFLSVSCSYTYVFVSYYQTS
jgi:hypothetical protein